MATLLCPSLGRFHGARGDHPGGVPAGPQRPGHPEHAAQAAPRRGRHQRPHQPHERRHAQVEAAALGRLVVSRVGCAIQW